MGSTHFWGYAALSWILVSGCAQEDLSVGEHRCFGEETTCGPPSVVSFDATLLHVEAAEARESTYSWTWSVPAQDPAVLELAYTVHEDGSLTAVHWHAGDRWQVRVMATRLDTDGRFSGTDQGSGGRIAEVVARAPSEFHVPPMLGLAADSTDRIYVATLIGNAPDMRFAIERFSASLDTRETYLLPFHPDILPASGIYPISASDDGPGWASSISGLAIGPKDEVYISTPVGIARVDLPL
jgi:hypothetical protein